MKLFNSAVAIIVLLFLSGCSNGKKKSDRQKLENKIGQTYDAAKKYTADQKKAIEKRFQDGIDSVNKQIEQLKAKSSNLSSSAQKNLNDQLDKLEDKKESLQDQLDKLRNSSGSAWDDLEQHVKRSYDELKDGVEKAAKEFQD